MIRHGIEYNERYPWGRVEASFRHARPCINRKPWNENGHGLDSPQGAMSVGVARSMKDARNVVSVAVPLAPQVKEILFAKKVDPRLSDPAYLGRFVGDYELSGHFITVALRGHALTLNVPGEPQYQLVPGLDGGFTLKELSSFGLKFEENQDSEVIAALVSRPNGIVRAKRKEKAQ